MTKMNTKFLSAAENYVVEWSTVEVRAARQSVERRRRTASARRSPAFLRQGKVDCAYTGSGKLKMGRLH